ncbi:hypothetical protein [Aneurinibacillus migulanus]|nr:hypothetical protein [Aneurinibacillus migulanus]MCP1358469.1 hypothetical protein [Aneurinibacillus migulanus]
MNKEGQRKKESRRTEKDPGRMAAGLNEEHRLHMHGKGYTKKKENEDLF